MTNPLTSPLSRRFELELTKVGEAARIPRLPYPTYVRLLALFIFLFRFSLGFSHCHSPLLRHILVKHSVSTHKRLCGSEGQSQRRVLVSLA